MRSEVKVGTLCNNNCIFCLNEDHTILRSTDSIKNEIKSLAEKGIDTIQFTGGEITIRKDYFDILNFARQKGLKISIQTNGRAFYYLKMAEMTVQKEIDSFLVSLHAHNEELNRKLTNVTGSYQQTVQGIKNLIYLGQIVNINTVINKFNVDFLPDIMRHHIHLRPKAVQLSWCRAAGNASKNNYEVLPKYDEHISKLKESIRIAKNAGQDMGVIGVPLCLLREHKKHIAQPYQNTTILRQGKILAADDTFNKERKTILDECKKCNYLNECAGVLNGYLRKYGEEEFKRMCNPKTTVYTI